jgi:microcystin-dependent protein
MEGFSDGGRTMRKTTVFAWISAACAALAALPAAAEEVGAAVPGTVNFQARLVRTADGVAEPLGGIQHVAFRLYDAAEGGTLVWARSFPVTCTADGTFNIVLDDGGSRLGTPAEDRLVDAFQGTERYFELEVEGLGTLRPRMRVPTAPYAFQSQYALWGEGGFDVGATLSVADDAGFQGALQADGASVASLTVTSGGGSLGSATVTGDVTVPPGKPNDAKGVIPVGGILLWTQSAVPDGWAVCDGSVTNGLQTPDLSGLFVMGADADHPAGSTGGAARVTLTETQMPRHDHKYTGPSGKNQGTKGWIHGDGGDIWRKTGDHPDATVDTGTAGKNQAHENRPPFYALYYIMRVR